MHRIVELFIFSIYYIYIYTIGVYFLDITDYRMYTASENMSLH